MSFSSLPISATVATTHPQKKGFPVLVTFPKLYAPICALLLTAFLVSTYSLVENLSTYAGIALLQPTKITAAPAQHHYHRFASTARFIQPIHESYFRHAHHHTNGHPAPWEPVKRAKSPDYNELEFDSLQLVSDERFRRRISPSDEERFEKERRSELRYMERHDLGSKVMNFEDLDFPRECVRPQWTYNIHPNCNEVHQISYDRTPHSLLQQYDLQYLGHGYHREAVRFTPIDGSTPFVIKSKRTKHDLDRRNLHKINTEANIYEVLSASKVIIDIYGQCGSTIVVQSAHDILEKTLDPRIGGSFTKQLRKEEVHDVHPMNNYTVSEKVNIALAMAEGLAELHGFEGGVMVNNDIDVEQWLVGEDGSVIFNDFNNAIYMEWNLEKQKYCKYYCSFGGTFKAPEVYDGTYVDETVDVWPMGNLIFGLLVGLYPYHELSDSREIQHLTKKRPPYIDPRYQNRSYAERRLVEIMNQCHKLDPSERVDIFEVVAHLRETKRVMSQQ